MIYGALGRLLSLSVVSLQLGVTVRLVVQVYAGFSQSLVCVLFVVLSACVPGTELMMAQLRSSQKSACCSCWGVLGRVAADN